MASEPAEPDAVYEVYCRECDWRAGDDPVDLKGAANLIAGRHISETGHVVVVKTVETTSDGTPDDDFHRGRDRRVTFERLRLLRPGESQESVRSCGPVECVVESG